MYWYESFSLETQSSSGYHSNNLIIKLSESDKRMVDTRLGSPSVAEGLYMTLKALVTHRIVTSSQKLVCYHISLTYAKLRLKKKRERKKQPLCMLRFL